MKSAAAILIVLVVLAGGRFSLNAQEPAALGDLTADELMAAADAAYNKREFGKAAKLYTQFVESYGKSKEPQILDIIRRRSYTLALCFVQDKNYAEAVPAIERALSLDPPLETGQVQDLKFWLGACQLQEKEYETAVKTLREFVAGFPPGSLGNPSYARQYPAVLKIPEAELMIGNGLLLDDKFDEAAKYFQEIAGRLPAQERGRALVLGLYSLLQEEDYDAALALVENEFPRVDDLLQIVAFQTLTLQLGNHFLEQGRSRDAILCLQKIWPAERLLRHQNNRLEALESRLAALEANPNSDPYHKLVLGQQIAKVRREIESFSKIENFDSALRLRLATAYQQMQRHRESALVMEAMLEEMPPDPLVEAASVNLVQTWGEIERWPKVIEAATAFAEIFPSSKHLPLVLYSKGIAEQKALDYAAALATFDGIRKKHTGSEFAPRAQFMKGFTELLAEKNKEAVATMEEFRKKHPEHELADAARYWGAMGLSLDKQFEACREAMQAYLDEEKTGAFRSAAMFRKAYCAQQLEDYETSIRELSEYLRKYPEGEEASEARVLLGDALMNEGRMEDGISVFAAIDPADVRFYEEGVFKTAKALKLMEEYGRLLEHLQSFIQNNPRSPRVAEAIFQAGWVHRQNGDADKARQMYWDAIEEYGDDPSIRSVDDLFPALARLYPGPEETPRYAARLRDLRENAGDRKTLSMRSLWAEALAWRKIDPDRSRGLMLQAAELADVSSTNPLLLADFAEALAIVGKVEESEQVWRDLVKWNPRAPQKDRAFAALGLGELSRGNEKAALTYFDRFERETLGSVLMGKVLLARARLLEDRGEFDTARKSLETLLASQYAAGPEKCEALFRIGEMYMREGKPALAVPYFQRIYVMHRRWTDWVARAYFRSGEAFEKLNDSLAARRTYQELTGNEDLSDYEETARAKERLQALGGPLPPETPEEPPAG